jgi:helicase
MVEQLEEWEFITVGAVGETGKKNTSVEDSSVPKDFVSALKLAFKKQGDISTIEEKLSATLLGHRVSELYLDPYTAREIIQSLKSGLKKKSDNLFNEYSIMHLICNCLELRPLLRVKTREVDDIVEKINQRSECILTPIPEMFDEAYEEFLNVVKTAEFFIEWLDEKDEEYLLEKYDVRPGELHAKRERADWLLYSSEELSKLLKMHVLMKDIAKLRFRLKYGAKEELIPLLQLKNIGRIRARKMFDNRIRDISDVKRIDMTTLVQLLGKTVAIDIKKQVGQEHSEEKVVVKENKRKGQINLDDY